MIPTPHNEASNEEAIAKVVLMPGDPLRAKFIAENFLEDSVQFNSVRNMFGYTGKYKNKKISVMGSGMGMPSIGIYSYELFAFYGVEHIIRIGSAGAYHKDLDLYDLFLVEQSWSESTFTIGALGKEIHCLESDEELNSKIIKKAGKLKQKLNVGKVHSSDVFYQKKPNDFADIYKNNNCQAVEMESFALFANAKALNKKATCLLTISDNLVTGEATSSKERQKSFTAMMELALETAREL